MFSKSKYLFILFFFILSGVSCYAQNYNPVLNYNFNGTIVNGVKIKTKIPFANSSHMPIITIEGYNYGTGEVIGISLVWYIYNRVFTNYSASSYGSYTPLIRLSNENGLVVIYIDDKPYFQRFTVRAFSQGINYEQSSWFQDWTVTDETLTGTETATVNYRTRLNPQIASVNGNLGIGTSNPTAALELDFGAARKEIAVLSDGDAAAYGDIKFQIKNQTSLPTGKIGGWQVSHRKDGYFSANTVGESSLEFYGSKKGGGFLAPLSFKSNGDVILVSDKNAPGGNVAIGTTDPKGYKLAVAGKIRATEIKVEATPWPDYVFAKDYKLPSLKETEQHINEKGHLPGIPSAEEVKANGIDLGEMNAKLLQKIEELTLHIINLEKRIDEMESAKTKK